MSPSRFLARSASLAARSDVCVFFHTRQQFANARNSSFRFSAGTLQPRRTYALNLDVKRLRTDVDKRSRVGWYILQKKQGALLVNADKAEAIYKDFVAHNHTKSYRSLVKSFTTSSSRPSLFISVLTSRRVWSNDGGHRWNCYGHLCYTGPV